MMLNETYILRSYSDSMLHRNHKLDVCKHKSEQQCQKKTNRNPFTEEQLSSDPDL